VAETPSRALRTTFDTVADLYDQARPAYPPALFDDIVALSGLPPGGHVLEIGPGTGQATLAMARRGYRITAVELGANLAAIARRNLAAFPLVDVQVSSFEYWPLPDEPFDLVLAVTSFHWLDAAVALPKIASALRPGGALAITAGSHVAGTKDDQFFADAQACYEAHDPDVPSGIRLQPPDEIPLAAPEPNACGLFAPAQCRRHVWTRDFTTQTYIDELRTYSGNIALSEENRTALLSCIATLIDSRYNGSITKAYLTDLKVAKKPL
jgi:SAM-dependent methyltransferase